MLCNGSVTLIQVHRMKALMPVGFPQQQAAVTGDISTYAILALIAGLAATAAAGPVARLLTFDAFPPRNGRDIDDILIRR
jgi:hypothetical protein